MINIDRIAIVQWVRGDTMTICAEGYEFTANDMRRGDAVAFALKHFPNEMITLLDFTTDSVQPQVEIIQEKQAVTQGLDK